MMTVVIFLMQLWLMTAIYIPERYGWGAKLGRSWGDCWCSCGGRPGLASAPSLKKMFLFVVVDILPDFNQQWRMFWFCSFSQISSPLLSIFKNFQIRMGTFHKLNVYFWKLLGPKPISGPDTRQFTIACNWTGFLFKTNATPVLSSNLH